MKKSILSILLLSVFALSSCGSKTPSEIAEEVCACFEAAGDDEDKRAECGKKSMAAMDQFKKDDNKEGAKEYMDKFNGGTCK
jgi:predicted small lipoprotein YifL